MDPVPASNWPPVLHYYHLAPFPLLLDILVPVWRRKVVADADGILFFEALAPSEGLGGEDELASGALVAYTGLLAEGNGLGVAEGANSDPERWRVFHFGFHFTQMVENELQFQVVLALDERPVEIEGGVAETTFDLVPLNNLNDVQLLQDIG